MKVGVLQLHQESSCATFHRKAAVLRRHKSSPKRRGWRKHLGEVRAGAEEGRGVSVPAPDWEQWEGTSQEPGVTPAQAGSSPAR